MEKGSQQKGGWVDEAVESGYLSSVTHATTSAGSDALEFTWSFPFVSLHREGTKGSAWDAVAALYHRHPLAG